MVKFDVTKSTSVGKTYQLQGVPTLLIFKDGAVVDSAVGLKTKDEYVKLLNKQY